MDVRHCANRHIDVPVDRAGRAERRAEPIGRSLLEWKKLPTIRTELRFQDVEIVIETGKRWESQHVTRTLWRTPAEHVLAIAQHVFCGYVQDVMIAPVPPVHATSHPTQPLNSFGHGAVCPYRRHPSNFNSRQGTNG